MWSGQSVAFEIPAQSLDRALLAYGSETGIQILYDAGLVAGKRSNSVSGHFAPQQGLELLLRGTGLRVRYTSPGAITLASVDDSSREVLALNVMRVEADPLVIGDTRRFNGYGESLQADIIAALRRHPITSHGSYEVVLRVWVGADGAIARSELLGSTRQPGQDQAILDAVEGVGVGRKPPADMPQPILFRFRAQPID
nr:secretin and TonB N-terminal domain-containing protein [uncultured Brevundimonas sp.]